MQNDSRRSFEVLAFLEGTSLIVLLGVAMPLKYLAGIALATRVMGLLHGLAFLAYAVTLLDAFATRRWPRRTVGLGMLAAFLPGGTFVFVNHLRRVPRAAGLTDAA
jgi:integral membrane protein